MPSPRFAILKAGTAYRETRESRGDFDRMVLDLLSEPGQTWDVHDVEHGHFPTDPTAYDGFIITGSRYAAYDDLPWVRELLALVRESYQRQQILLGICFGHQVLAQALGGEVRPNPKGWDIGVRTVTWTDAGKRAKMDEGAPDPLRIFELHQDIVTRLPPAAVHLASSDQTLHESFSLGSHTLGIQGHPEFDRDVIRVALDKFASAQVISPAQAVESAETLAQNPHSEFLRSWLRGFLRPTGKKVREPIAVPAPHLR